ncbi:MAG TPA: DUF4391 domain-containing protein, partial [Lamprocystis sp. (in: g-proteobacteria)]|nr:DUF4391 domain-containing protein [Lamprocystis sp. (in: g-proteobacteria)]
MPQTHFYALYTALADRLVALDCAGLSGEYRVKPLPALRALRRARRADCRALDVRIGGLKALIRKETQFNRQLELHTLIKQISNKLRHSFGERLPICKLARMPVRATRRG